MKFNYKTLIIWGVIVILFIFGIRISQMVSDKKSEEINFTLFIEKAKAGEVQKVRIEGPEFTGEMLEGGVAKKFYTVGPSGERVMEILADNKVPTTYVKPEDDSFLQTILASWLPMLIFILFFVFFMKQMQGGNGKAFSFGKSRHRMISKDSNPITFKDVAGVEEAKEELEEIVDFLKDPSKYTKMGAKIPHGVLLVGSPGTGKTLLAKAVAGEANVPFATISGSDFVEMFVGVGASRVRDMFEQAREKAPCILFIDEIDAVGRHRGAGLGGGHDEREQTLNQMLVEMDGFGTDESVIVMAATNRPDVLDPALLRPGRFDRQVEVPLPDVKGREEILKVHSKKIKMADNVDLSQIAKGTPGFSGADLANLLNEAALLAARNEAQKVVLDDVEEAKDKVLMGKQRKSMQLTEDEKRDIAYHEAGHAVVGYFTEGADEIHKVSIIPRGRALGVTLSLPEKDKFTHNRKELIGRLNVLLGGRAAEAIFTSGITTGAGNDIERATNIARNMVMRWGMSDTLGPVNYAENEEAVFLGRELAKRNNHSEYTAKLIDEEVHKMLGEAYNYAARMLEEKKDKVIAMVESLMQHETIDREIIESILGPKPEF